MCLDESKNVMTGLDSFSFRFMSLGLCFFSILKTPLRDRGVHSLSASHALSSLLRFVVPFVDEPVKSRALGTGMVVASLPSWMRLRSCRIMYNQALIIQIQNTLLRHIISRGCLSQNRVCVCMRVSLCSIGRHESSLRKARMSRTVVRSYCASPGQKRCKQHSLVLVHELV